eukprot:8025318-Heterocapsa_arctica.AAC.1
MLPTQPRWGATLTDSVVKASKATWAASIHATVRDEDTVEKAKVARLLLDVGLLLERRGYVLGVRDFAPGDPMLEALLMPRKAKTAARHVRMFARLEKHVVDMEADVPASEWPVPLLDRTTVASWILAM